MLQWWITDYPKWGHPLYSVVFRFYFVLFNFIRCPCNVFDMIVSAWSVHCYLLTYPLDLPALWNAAIYELIRAFDHILLPQKFHDDISTVWELSHRQTHPPTHPPTHPQTNATENNTTFAVWVARIWVNLQHHWFNLVDNIWELHKWNQVQGCVEL